MSIVLVVDDDESIRVWLERDLTGSGHRVLVAATGPEALEIARLHNLALALIDQRMPGGLDGVATLEALLPDHPGLVALLFTGFELSPQELDRALRAGFAGYLQKEGDEPAAVRERIAAELQRQADGPASDGDIRTTCRGRPLDAASQVSRAATRASVLSDARRPTPFRHSSVPGDSQRLRRLLGTIADPSTPAPQALACAEAFRLAYTGAIRTGDGRVDEGDPLGADWSLDHRSLDPRVAACIDRLLTAGPGALKLRENVVARELGVDRSRLGRLLLAGTGCGFREWRWAIALPIAVRALANPATPVKEAAFEAGFSSQEKLAQALSRLLGVTATELRRFLADRQ